MMIRADDVKTLRERTGAGMMNCKKALDECRGDMEKAVDYLRKKGLAEAAKKQGRVALEGQIASYIHNGKIGVLVEVNCETDFVARNGDFQAFLKDMAIHIAAANPKFVREEDMDESYVNKEKEIQTALLVEQGKSEKMIPNIVKGKIKKLSSEVCLMSQKFVKNPDLTVEQLKNELVLKLGENINIRRFVRFELGEGMEKGLDVAKTTGKQ